MDPLPDFIRDQASAMAAGAFGACMSLPFMRELKPLRAVTCIFAGVGCAFYFTPLVADYIGFSLRAYGAVAFVIGFSGFMILSALMRLLENFSTDPIGVFTRIFDAIRGRGRAND